MDNITEQWTYNELGYDYWNNDLFDTKEETEKAAVDCAREKKLNEVVIGRCELTPLPCCIDTENILYELDNEYADDAGSEYDGDLYEAVKEEDKKWLEEKLSEVIKEFHKRTGIESRWYTVNDTYTIEVKQENIE